MNKELALRVLERIKARPETWDQTYWVTREKCGTAFCFAGHVVHEVHPAAVPCLRDGFRLASIFELDGEKLEYQTEAARLLEISGEDAAELFNSCNTLKSLEDIINAQES
jgi:hypothetical protein